MHTCDVCSRVAYTEEGRIASGWRKLMIWNEDIDSEPGEWQDTCDTCSEVLRDSLAVRRRAEKGKHRVPEKGEYSTTPEQADAIAKTWLSRSAPE